MAPPSSSPPRRRWLIIVVVLLVAAGGIFYWRPWRPNIPAGPNVSEKMQSSPAYAMGFATGLSSNNFRMPRLSAGELAKQAKEKYPDSESDRQKFEEGYREGFEGFK